MSAGWVLSGRCEPGLKPGLDDPFLLMLCWGGARDASARGSRKGGTTRPRDSGR